MGGTKYYVDVEFRTSGDAAAGAGKMGAAAEKLKSNFSAAKAEASGMGDGFSAVGTAAAGAFTSAVEKVGALALGMAQIAGAGALGAITYGVTGLNKELETTRVSLAAVLNANGQSTGGIEGAMESASGWIKQMKIDARDLPGEFEDLLGIVQTGAGAAFKMGLDPQRFEKMASSAMAAGKALAVPLDQAGRELAQLMEGRAGAHNVFGTRIGIDAHSTYKDVDGAAKRFNELTKEGRAKVLDEKIGAFQPAIKAFANTYDAQSSTAVDNVKQLLQIGTQELFGRVVNDLRDLNEWMEANRGNLEAWAREIGHDLVSMHDKARALFEEWAPILKQFGENAYKKFGELWKEAEPYVAKIAGYMKEFFKDPESIDKMITLLKLYVGIKAYGALTGGPMAGLLGAGTQALTGAAGAAAGGATTSVFGATVGGPAAGAVTGLAGIAAIAGIGAAVWQYEELQKDRRRMADEEFNNFRDYAKSLSESMKSVENQFGYIDMAGQLYQEELARITENSGEAAGALYSFAVALQNAEADMKGAKDQMDQWRADDINDGVMQMVTSNAQTWLLTGKTLPDDTKRKDKVAGSGNTIVNGNIYFTISSNQAPGQIAREVQKNLIEKRRFRTSSPDTKNWSIAR